MRGSSLHKRLIAGYDPSAGAGDYYFDRHAAEKATGFFKECLTFTSGAWRGKPFVLREWQRVIVWNLFGWKRPGGTRRYRESLIYIPRKNGKTEFAAGLACLLAFADDEPAAAVYCAAADREQARLVFAAAKTMIDNEQCMSSRSQSYVNAIMVPETGSFLRVISAEAYSKHGVNAHAVIIDELHAQPNRELCDVLATSMGARRQPFLLYITTADFDRESVCNEKYEYACKVRDGVIDDPTFMPVIYEATNDDDWKSPDTWEKANPNLGVSLYREYLERECKRAQETPSYENTFKRLHLNIQTRQDVRWLSLDEWDACGVDNLDDLNGEPCFGGLDLSSTTDLSALVLAFPRPDGAVAVVPYFWVPADGARKREQRDRVPYETWIHDGSIKATPGNVVDYDRIRHDIAELAKIYNIKEIGVDRWNSTQLALQIQGDGVPMFMFGQGFRDMNQPSKELEKLIVSQKLRHCSSPVMRWMVSNVAAETDAAGNIKPSKSKSSERIDGIVALIMALGRLRGHIASESVYETREMVVIGDN